MHDIEHLHRSNVQHDGNTARGILDELPYGDAIIFQDRANKPHILSGRGIMSFITQQYNFGQVLDTRAGIHVVVYQFFPGN